MAVMTATISLTAPQAQAAVVEQDVASVEGDQEQKAQCLLLGAFLLGIAQGYMEEVNNQRSKGGQTADPVDPLGNTKAGEFDYVLN